MIGRKNADPKPIPEYIEDRLRRSRQFAAPRRFPRIFQTGLMSLLPVLQGPHIAKALAGFRIGYLVKARNPAQVVDGLAVLLQHTLLEFPQYVSQRIGAAAQYR